MRRVLVAFDGSEPSKKALEKVIKFSQKNSSIFVLYVIDEGEIKWPSRIDISLIWSGNIDELEKNMLEIHKEYANRILKQAESIAKKNKRKVKTICEIGFPPDKIVEVAERLKCDLIAVGSTSRLAFEFILGSVAQKVVLKSKIPVLVVKQS
ncbi:TRAP-T-associated universal stress protein TeaD [bacterium HR19]|nr:TRAP-T-associated universal stress protein TeaD [bacterium HR19]